jgi:hypothetical protein
MTNEQRLRGADAAVDWAVFVTGYDDAVLETLMHADLGRDRFEKHGGASVDEATYRMHFMLTDREVRARP